MPQTSKKDRFVFFGSHGDGPNLGFSLARFDPGIGTLTPPIFLQEAVAPAYFLVHPDGKRLYTCNSSSEGSVSAYAIDPATAQLTLLNQRPSGGGEPCYVCLDDAGYFLLVANYSGGSIAVFALRPDGSLGEQTAFVQQVGASINPARQTQAHAHSVCVDPTNRFVLAADLGADKVFVYRFDAKTGALQAHDPPFAAVAPGAGPRHLAFAPNGRFLYLINELASSVIRFGWNPEAGVLTPFETVSTLPEGFSGASFCAEILAHPSGKFLYATNRGHDSVAVFAVEEETGRLTLVQHIASQGKTPRNAEFDPTARWLLVTNHDSDNVVVFGIAPDTGQLRHAGPPVPAPAPFCVRFLPTGSSESSKGEKR